MAGAKTVGALVVGLSVDVATLKTDLATAGRAIQTTSEKAATDLTAIRKSLESAITPLGDLSKRFGTLEASMGTASSAAASLGKALVFGAVAGASLDAIRSKVFGVIESMANLKNLSEKTGTSVENLSKLSFVAKASGSDIESVSTALTKLAKSMAGADDETKGAGKAFEFLGINAKDAAGNLKDPSVMFGEIAKQLDKYQDGAGKAALAQAIFGKAGADMLPTLKLLAESGDQVAKVTDAQATAARVYERDVLKLNAQQNELYKTVAIALMPTMKDFVEVLTDASRETNVVNGAAKDLSKDHSIEDWADSGGMAIALLIDGMRTLPGIFATVGAGIGAVAARVRTEALRFIPGQEAAFKTALMDEAAANKEASDALGAVLASDADKYRKALQAKIDARKAFANGEGVDNWDLMGKPGANFVPKTVKPGAATKVAVDDYDKLNKAIQSRLALADQELAKGYPLTEQEKEIAKLIRGRAEGTINLTEVGFKKLQQDIAGLGVEEKIKENYRIRAQLEKIRVDMINDQIAKYDKLEESNYNVALAAKDYSEQIAASNKEADFELTLMGRTASERALAIEQYKIDIELQKKILDIKRQMPGADEQAAAIASITATAEAAKIGAAARASGQEFIAVWDSVDKTAHDTFVSIFNSGKSAFDRLRDTLKNGLLDLLYQMTVKKWIFNIGASITGGVAGTAQAAGGSAASSAGSSFLSSAAGSVLGGAFATTSGASAAAIASGSTYATGFASQQSLMLLAQETTGAVSTIAGAASSLSSVAAAAGPYVLAAIAAYALFKSLNGGETRYGGGYNTTPGGQITLAGGPSGGEITGPQTRALIQGTADSLQKALKDFGSSAIVGAFTAGGESSKYGKANVFAGGSVNGVGFGMGGGDNDPKVKLGDADPGQVAAALALQLKRATLEGLQAANIGGIVTKYLSSLGDLASLTSDAADAALKQIGEIESLTVAMKTLPFPQLRDASLEAVMAISDVVGGLGALGTKLGSYYANFYTQDEQTAHTLAGVSDALKAVNLTLPDSREGFRALVEAQNLTTTSGQSAYAALINVADAFASVVPVATAAAAATNSTTKAAADATYKTQRGLDIQLLQAQGHAEAALAAQRADVLSSLVGEQKVRQQQIYDAQDAATAQTAYNTALASVTTATQAVTAATQTVAGAYQTLVADLQNAQSKVASISQQITQAYRTALTTEQSADAQVQSARQTITNGYVSAQQAVNNLRQQEADGLRKLAVTIRDFLGTMTTTAIGGGSLASQQAALRGQLSSNAALAQGGDQVAAGKLTGIASSLLTVAQSTSATAVDFARQAAFVANTLSTTASALDSRAGGIAGASVDPMVAATQQLALYTAAVQRSGASYTSASTDLLAGYNTAVAAEKVASDSVAYWSSAVSATGASMNMAASSLVSDYQDAAAKAGEAQKALDEANVLRGTIDLSISSSLQKFVAAMATLNASIASLAAAQSAVATTGAVSGVVTSAAPTTGPATAAAAARAPALGGRGSAALLATIAAQPKRTTFSNEVFLDNYDAKLESATGIAAALNISVPEAFLLSGGHSQAFWQEVHKEALAGGMPTEASVTAKGFAMGGDHRGGLRIVGERGPELEATGPSRIFNASQTADILGGGSTAAEVRALREEMKAALIAIAQNTGRSAKVSERWEGDGLPATRTLA